MRYVDRSDFIGVYIGAPDILTRQYLKDNEGTIVIIDVSGVYPELSTCYPAYAKDSLIAIFDYIRNLKYLYHIIVFYDSLKILSKYLQSLKDVPYDKFIIMNDKIDIFDYFKRISGLI